MDESPDWSISTSLEPFLDVFDHFRSRPGEFFLGLAADPGIVMIWGPLLFSFIWGYLKTSAVARKVEHAEELGKADYIVNLAVHVASVVFGGLLYIFINITKYKQLKHDNVWADRFELLFILTLVVLAIGIWRRGFINGQALERYNKILPDQITAPWDLGFTWYRMVCAMLSWITTILHMMYEASRSV